MNAKDKAEELVNKYLLATPVGFHIDDAKQCALIAVDEIIKSSPNYPSKPLETLPFFNASKFWEEVKQEIEKL